MIFKVSTENKAAFKNIYNDNNLIINYVVSYNNGFIQFNIETTIDNMPINLNELIKYNKNLENIYKSNNNLKLLITINNNIIKYKNQKKVIKIQYLEEINYKLL
jgi:hypothetical protein